MNGQQLTASLGPGGQQEGKYHNLARSDHASSNRICSLLAQDAYTAVLEMKNIFHAGPVHKVLFQAWTVEDWLELEYVFVFVCMLYSE